MTIAITGATGQLGRLVVAKLKTKMAAANLVALARTPAKAADLGIAAREADYSNPGTLAGALKGIDTLLLISSSEIGQRAAQHRNVIDAAKQAGVKHIVYTSLLHADRSPIGLAPEHVETEALIKASGLTFTFLRNGWYTENYTGSLGAALAHGAMIGAAGDAPLSTAARKDYAEAIAVTALDAAHAGQTYELAGDTAHTMADLAAEVARQSGKPVAWVPMAEADYAKALEGFGLPAGFAAALADSDASAQKGSLHDSSRTLSRLIGRPTTPFAETVRAALA